MKTTVDRDASSGSCITYENLNSLLALGDISQACLKHLCIYPYHNVHSLVKIKKKTLQNTFIETTCGRQNIF